MLGRKSILLFISILIVNLFNGIIFIIAINTFLPILFGYQKIIASYMGFFVFLSSLGFRTSHLKIMAEQGEEGKNEAFTSFAIIKLTLTVFSTIIIFLIFFIQFQNGTIQKIEEIKFIFFIIFFQKLLISINSIFEISFRAIMQVAKSEVPIIVGNFINIVFSLIAILVFKSFYLFLSGSILIELIKLSCFLFLKKPFHITHLNYKILKKYLILGSIFLLPNIISTLTENLGPFFFLKHYDENLLGIYSVIVSFLLMIKTVEFIFQALLVPSFTKFYSKKDLKSLKYIIELFEKYMLILNGFLIMGIIIFSKFIMTFFLGEIYYENGKFLFYGCLISLIEIIIFTPYFNLLIVAEKMKLITILFLLKFVLSLTSWIFFIPDLNIIALEMGNWFFIILGTIIIRIYCKKKFGIGGLSIKQIIHLIVLLIFYTSCFLILYKDFNLLFSVLFFLLMESLYLIFLLMFKIIEKTDIITIQEAINPKKMMKYIKSEIKK